MTYVIRYFREGIEQAVTPWADSLVRAKKIAAHSVNRRGMDRAEITDESGKRVWWRIENTVRQPVAPTDFMAVLSRLFGRVAGSS